MASIADEMTTDDTAAFAQGDRPRTIVAGHYAIDLNVPLGAGGMALVYRGRDLRTRRDVALKTLRLEYRRDPETRARFRREARTMAFLTHPNVARVYDLYEDTEAPWVVLEYVPGCSLKAEINERGSLGLEETADILDQVADALAHLHARGLVHLDVKPQNLILMPEGTVKLIDFGLAQRAGQPQEMIGGAAFGTAAYLAPEQACGEPVDAATDVYALGCVVYELLTGRPPFEPAAEGELKNDVIRAHLDHQPVPPSAGRPDLQLPAWVDDVVFWALAKRPEDRYRDVSSFARVFRDGVSGTIAGSEALTSRVVAHPVVDTRLVPATAPARRSGLGGRAAAAIYRAGGRGARRSRRLQALLWRLIAAIAIGNLVLALLLVYDRGAVPGLGGARGGLRAGDTARVTQGRLRVRSAPGLTSDTIAVLEPGARLSITGQSVVVDGEAWWPVTIEQNGQAMNGYVWEGGIAPVRRTGATRLHDLGDRAKKLAGAVADRLGLPAEIR